MKFTNGYWLLRPGVRGHYPARVHEFEVGDGQLTVHASTNPSPHRAASLSCPVLSVRLSAPAPDVVRVRITHHSGGVERGPAFEIAEAPVEPEIEETDAHLSFRSGGLTVRVKRDGWGMEFVGGGGVLTETGFRNMGWMTVDDGPADAATWIEREAGRTAYMKEELRLGVGECIYGLGERFTAFVKNGQSVETWNEDGGTSSEHAYKSIPFCLSSRGYGVLVNHPERVSFEVGSEKVSRVGFSVPGEALEYLVIYGPSPKEVLEKYTALTGRPALPPPWSFGLWLTTSFTTDYDEETVTQFVQGMADRDLPLHVFHFDCFWMRGFHWCDFEWDPAVFPDPQGMLRRLKERGLRICVWINPYIAQRSALFEEGRERGYLLRRANGDVWQWDQWQAGMGLVDFTNPDAYRWFGGKLQALVDMGVDCVKTDFGEHVPTDVVYADGSDPMKMHNYYALLYNRCVHEALEEKLGKGQGVLFARSATVGSQQYPVHWGGDSTATYESMAETLRGGLSLGMSGFGFWSHDIGGFESTAAPDVYKRWIAFGLLSSHSRLHGSSSYRVPWLYDEESVDVLRHFTKLKCRLMPYLWRAAQEAHDRGVPVMRAMVLEFPDDPACAHLDRQYMLGPSLLVAPVMREDGVVEYYVPAGRWTHLLSGKVVEGPRWVRETHDYMSLPLLVRPNTRLPMGARDDRPDYDHEDGVEWREFETSDA
jgi:alpha-D-xyloside xylohydrolase